MEKKKTKWIKRAIKHPGEFSSKAERAGKSTREYAKEHEHDSGKLGRQARLAQTLMKMHKRKKEEGHKRPTIKGFMKKMHGTND